MPTKAAVPFSRTTSERPLMKDKNSQASGAAVRKKIGEALSAVDEAIRQAAETRKKVRRLADTARAVVTSERT